MAQKQYPNTEVGWIDYLTNQRYLTLNEIEYRKSIVEKSGCDFDEIFNYIKEYREKEKQIIFKFSNKSFYFVETDELKNRIAKIKKFYNEKKDIVNDNFLFELLNETLVFEGYYSSTIEGAYSTIKRAKTLAKGLDTPKNKDEIMVLNNFKVLIELKDKKDKISHNLIKNIHKIITKDTLEKDTDVGEYRTEANEIVNSQMKVIFTPPSDIKEMNKMLDELLEFISSKNKIDEIYKAIAFHFLFAYIHPFIDGNGRTIRVLFAYLLKNLGYELFYYISLSEIIYEKKGKGYYKAFIDVERSKNGFDMTYFFYYMSEVMVKSIDVLKEKINSKKLEIIQNQIEKLNIELTSKQFNIIKLLSDENYSFMQTSNNLSTQLQVSNDEIKKDLELLMDFDLIEKIELQRKNKIYYRLKIDFENS